MSNRLFNSRTARRAYALLAVLAVSLLAISPVARAQDPLGEQSFATPEDAITGFMQALAANDLPQIMQISAVDEMSEQFRFDLYTDRIRALALYAPAPADYPFYMEMNRAQFAWQFMSQVRNLSYGLLSEEADLLKGQTVMMDAEQSAQFVADVDPSRLAQIEVVAIDIPAPDIFYDERTQENWTPRAQIYGADEFTERVVLFQFEGDYYMTGFGLLRYGDDWKISQASSMLANTNSLGVAVLATEEAYQELITAE